MGESNDMKYLTNNIRTRTQGEGFSTGFLKDVTTYVSHSNRQAASKILAYQQDSSTSSFQLVISDYLENSKQLLAYCSALDKFVVSARKIHSDTQHVVQQYFKNKMETEDCLKILEKLKKVMKSIEDIDIHAQSAKLHQNIESLTTQFKTLCKHLEDEIAKIDEEKNRIHSQKKRTSGVYKQITSGIRVASVCATLLGIPFLPELVDIVNNLADGAIHVADVATNVADVTLGVGDATTSGASDTVTHPHIESVRETLVDFAQDHTNISKVIVDAGFHAGLELSTYAGHSILMSTFDNKLKALDNQKKGMDAARRQISILELDNIKLCIDKLVNRIDPLLAKTNIEITMDEIDYLMKDMKQKLEEFLEKIKDLEVEAKKCEDETKKAKAEVCGRLA